MYVLSIDSSGLTASAAIIFFDANGEKVIAETTLNAGYTHSTTLMPLIDGILRISGTSLSNIDYIACASGPGSFTGLRIGAATAMGLASSINIKMVNVSALDALAYNVINHSNNEATQIVVPIMDARRGEVYSAIYKNTLKLTRVTDYLADKIENIINIATSIRQKLDENIIFTGDGVTVHRELLEAHGLGIATQVSLLQRAASVGILAVEKIRNDETISPGEFKIEYIRVPQAERELK
ncbi:MAG: tRNA (adenosine(37)-N6)-threonylcarbamoyltransferase complex dimerization subunit type 1 TsaB [Defluviitaleaceae bacterium]|nr:tRNA (adenosine(37)-N6)-threonylcarbamoyltransferase complex dimerization subunit type 1 TsaB [Defluviitaleaceae bacterium]